MRKTVKADLPCPHCEQEVRFNYRNPAYTKKKQIEETRERILRLQKHIENLEKTFPISKEAYTCPYKKCKKLVYAKVTPRKIVLSKRVPKALRVTAELVEKMM